VIIAIIDVAIFSFVIAIFEMSAKAVMVIFPIIAVKALQISFITLILIISIKLRYPF